MVFILGWAEMMWPGLNSKCNGGRNGPAQNGWAEMMLCIMGWTKKMTQFSGLLKKLAQHLMLTHRHIINKSHII